MRIEILSFAAARDAVGNARMDLEVPEGARVEAVAALLASRHPGLGRLLPSLRYAVGEAFVEPDHALRAGDTLALIPPVSGG